jgi:hypothetical protein
MALSPDSGSPVVHAHAKLVCQAHAVTVLAIFRMLIMKNVHVDQDYPSG